MPRLQPIGDDVIIHPIDNPEKRGMIHLTEHAKRGRVNQGIVIAKGPSCRHDDLEIADHVLFNGYTGDKISLANGGIFFVIPEPLVLAVRTTSTVVLVDTEMMKRIIQGRMGELRLMNDGNEDESVDAFIHMIEDNLIERIDSITYAEGFEF